jgi:hypothetical protein
MMDILELGGLREYIKQNRNKWWQYFASIISYKETKLRKTFKSMNT